MDSTSVQTAVLRAQVAHAVATARAEGRRILLEPEGLIIAAALGLRVPRLVELRHESELRRLNLESFHGYAVVVKVMSPDIVHKTDVGGVRIVPKNREAIAHAITDIRAKLAILTPRPTLRGWLVCEFIQHGKGPGEQLLFGMRWTRDFGPVVTLGFGGVEVEHLARNILPGRDVAILSPAMADPAQIDRALEDKAIVPLICGGVRHQAPRLERGKLVGLLQQALRLAAASMPDELIEFEINPLVPTANGVVALDAMARLGPGPHPVAATVSGAAHSQQRPQTADKPLHELTPLRPQQPPQTADKPLHKLARLLQPRSMAIVGVSAKTNVGHIILNNCLQTGFDPGRLYVIKPGADFLEGCRCIPDLEALPEMVDLFVVSIDAAQVPALVEEAVARRSAESIILIPGGLGEGEPSSRRDDIEVPVGIGKGAAAHATPTVDTPAERIRAAVEAARRTDWGGPLLNGPNCLGVRSLPGHFDTLFIPRHKLYFPAGPASPVAFLSQSGAFAAARASQIPWLNPRYVITFGNQIDLTAGDYLSYLAADPNIEVFACYVEGFMPADGARWLQAAATIVASGRPVLLYRAGRTEAGAKAAASHTAAVAGEYAVTRELAKTAGVLVADSPADFDDLLRLCVQLRHKDVRGLRLGALSNAGFECVSIADHHASFTLPALDDSTQRALHDLLSRRRLDTIVGVRNPLDVTPILDDEPYADAARAILADPNVDVGIVACVPLTAALNTLPRDASSGPASAVATARLALRRGGGASSANGAVSHAEDFEHENALPRRLSRLHVETVKAWVAVVDSGPPYDPMACLLESDGIPVFRGAERALRLFSAYCTWRQRHAPAARHSHPAVAPEPSLQEN